MLIEQIRPLLKTVKKLRTLLAKAEARVEELSVINWYWDDDYLEEAIPAFAVGDNNRTGDILELRPIHELPTVYILLTDDGRTTFSTLEEAEKAKEVLGDG